MLPLIKQSPPHKRARSFLNRLCLVADPTPGTRPPGQQAHHDSLSMWASFFVLLNAFSISLVTIIHFKFYINAIFYALFTLTGHLVILRYFYCSRCDHYDNECASILYAPQLTRILFRRRDGTWTRVDTFVGTFTWMLISQWGTGIAALNHEFLYLLLNALAWFAWRTAHSALACQRCLNNHVCPKGKAAVAGENYFVVALFTLLPLPAIAWAVGYFV